MNICTYLKVAVVCLPLSFVSGKFFPSFKADLWNHLDRQMEVSGSIGMGAGLNAGISAAGKTFQYLENTSPMVRSSATVIVCLSVGIPTALVSGTAIFIGITALRDKL